MGSLEAEPEIKILKEVVHWEEGRWGRGSRVGQGKELSQYVVPQPRRAGFGRLFAQYLNSPEDLGSWPGQECVQTSSEKQNQEHVYLYIESELL